VKRDKRSTLVTVSADGTRVVSHAGSGCCVNWPVTPAWSRVTAVLADTYAGLWQHALGQVFTDMAVAIADGWSACPNRVASRAPARSARPRAIAVHA
jgi:hypothetical protein